MTNPFPLGILWHPWNHTFYVFLPNHWLLLTYRFVCSTFPLSSWVFFKTLALPYMLVFSGCALGVVRSSQWPELRCVYHSSYARTQSCFYDWPSYQFVLGCSVKPKWMEARADIAQDTKRGKASRPKSPPTLLWWGSSVMRLGEERGGKTDMPCALSCAAVAAPVCQVPFSQEPGQPLDL